MTDETAIQEVNGNTLALYGERDEIKELGQRIQKMLPGGAGYTESEALMLAQLAVAHELDPFNGEVWLIKDGNKVLGALIGIKGHRKHAKRQSPYWGFGQDGGFTRITDPKVLEGYKATPADVVFEYRIVDEATLESYTKQIGNFIKSAGVKFDEAVKLFGPPPTTLGIGIWRAGEKTKMKPAQCAMFRAEKDALKRRFDVKFRIELGGNSLPVEVAEGDDDPALVEIEAEYEELNGDEPKDAAEIVELLGYDQFNSEQHERVWDGSHIHALVMEKVAKNNPNAVAMLNLSNLDPDTAMVESVVAWGKLYRSGRDIGLTTELAQIRANDTTNQANAGISPR